ncbi:hypothetical protein AMTRI_Chr02g223290 [Amborella trichopoda]|uniref:Wall-associated receptor kinase galacturonan-binding domain-containing protein n=1 Tax=Amborella trichopoda TaxID=13333 RepID=W1P3J3_AMBTC|nr:wall-associated receptor kinase-like 20 [Amborella trichopoda]ERN02151.1 hypothetical protein AMTR_s00045p00185470 [Amborella trichopoda]|eukprot:XP_020520524.1 wall-associated receptor kinase-like 20 [Amborella trichopoda]
MESPKQLTSLLHFHFLFLVLCAAHRPYSALQCPNCGYTPVPYPLSTHPSCGNPNYPLHCSQNTLFFLSPTNNLYRVQSIDPLTQRLIISPPAFEPNSCRSLDLASGGLLLDESLPFNISSRNTVMLFNCSSNILLSPLNCSAQSPCRIFEEGGECDGLLCCSYLKDASMTSHRIRVRDGGCTAYTSVVAFREGLGIENWEFGVELQWAPL